VDYAEHIKMKAIMEKQLNQLQSTSVTYIVARELDLANKREKQKKKYSQLK
jgi:hypothetical protein